jgi:transposase
MAEPIRTIGCDLGDKYSSLFVLWQSESGEELTHRPKPIATTDEGFRTFFTCPPARVVVEVGTHSRWVVRLLKQLGHRVIVANPRRVQLISKSQKKTDDGDAELLARMGRADPKLLAPVEHRADAEHQALELVKARDQLVRVRTNLVVHIRSVVKSHGGGPRLPKCDAQGFHRRTKDLMPKELRPALLPLYRTLETLEERIKGYERQLARLAKKKYPDVDILTQVNGVGLLTAITFLLTIGDKTRIKRSRDAGAFLGLVPRKDQSGDSDKQLSITKAGDGMVRRLLVQSANYILGPFGADSDLRRWGLELMTRGGKNAKKRARVAVARKLAVVMHRLWTTGEVYQPLGYTQQRHSKRPAAEVMMVSAA